MSERGAALFSRGRGAPARLPGMLLLVYGLLFLNTTQFIGMVAVSPSYADALDLSKLETSLIFTVSGASSALFAIPAGMWCNRIGVRPVALGGSLVVAAALWLQGYAPSLGWLLVARVAIGAGFCAVLAAAPAWAAESVAPERRTTATAATMPVAGLGLLAGPTFCGAMIDAAGRGVTMAILSVALLVNVGALLLGPRHATAPHGQEPLLQTLAKARSSPLVVAGMLLFGTGVLAENVSGVLVPLQLDANGLSASAIGGIVSSGAITFLIVSVLMARASGRVTRLPFAAATTGLLAVAMVVLASSGATAPTTAGMILRTTVLAAMYTIAYPFAYMGAHRVGIGSGAVFAAMQIAGGGANAVGPFLAGKIGESAGDAAAYALVAGLALVTVAVLLRAHRRIGDSNPAGPATGAGVAP